MFPNTKGRSGGERVYKDLRKLCAGCPLRTPCRRLALDMEGTLAAGSRFGMWGGWSPHQRARIAELLGLSVEADPDVQGDLFDMEDAS